MITRSAKRKSMHLECSSPLFQIPGNEIQIQSRNSIPVESSGYALPGNEEYQKSVCNIHIHSPANEISTIKLSMPGIQPIIHVHPNNVIKTLELNIGNVTPVTGDKMELSFKNNSAGRDYLELDSNASSQKCLTDKMSEHTKEIKSDKSKNSRDSFSNKKSNSNKSSKNNNSNKNSKNSEEISNYTYDINSIKLNKAVVVLTDICKTKYYKAAFTDYAAKEQVKSSGIETKKEVSSPELKQESLESSTQINDNFCTNTTESTFDTGPSLKSVNSSPLSGSRLLTQLAEGCSFSEILKRFRIKNGNYLVDTLKREDTTNHENFNTEVEVHEDQVLKCETFSLNGDTEVEEGFLTLDVTGKLENVDFEDSNVLGVPQSSNCEESGGDIEYQRDQSLDSRMRSDHSENPTGVQSISEDVSADEETVDSSCLTSNMVPDSCNVITSEEMCNISESSKNQLSNTNNSFLNLRESEQPNLEVDEEGMRGKKFPGINKNKSKKKKRSKSRDAKDRHSPSVKKMKQSDQKSKTFKGKTKFPEEYIPLQAGGPTKFGVAMINQIKPYVQHDAKDFKSKVLFGDRNKRVSSSQHLRIYKLKQKVNRSIRG